MSYSDYMNCRVKVMSTDKSTYIKEKVVGKEGTIIKESSGDFGVLIDGKHNTASCYGVYWFSNCELKFLNDGREDIKMDGFEYVAIVNLLEDYNKKDYAFALYKEDLEVIHSMNRNAHGLVVVNARGKNNRILGTIKEIVPTEEYYNKNKNAKITAEVVGVVNMDRYILAKEENERLAELAKKKAAIEKELEEEINKRKSVEYYEAMANKYSDNPKLAELVAELKSLGA